MFPRRRLPDDVRHCLADEPVSACPDRVYHRGGPICSASRWNDCRGWAFCDSPVAHRHTGKLQRSSSEQTPVGGWTISTESRSPSIALVGLGKFGNRYNWQRVSKSTTLSVITPYEASSGLDASIRREFSFPCNSLAFDESGQRLLMAGVDTTDRLWNTTDNTLQELELTSTGPVVFGEGRFPRKIIVKSSHEFMIWDVLENQAVQTLRIPFENTDMPELPQYMPRIAMASRASMLAAASTLPDGTDTLAVWKTNQSQADPAILS